MITLAEYLGFIFAEITRARGSADRVSATIAEAYAADPIMKHFSVPRFKIPEMTVTVPMLISGAKFSGVLKFKAEPSAFSDFVNAELGGAVLRVHGSKPDVSVDITKIVREFFLGGIKRSGTVRAAKAAASKSKVRGSRQAPPARQDISEFHNLVASSLNTGQAETIVKLKYAELFRNTLAAKGLSEDYKRLFPKDELFADTLAKVQSFVAAHTVVDRVKMENLLVNPETHIIKTQGNEYSVLTITAKISEEGIFVKSLKDEHGRTTTTAVEFE